MSIPYANRSAIAIIPELATRDRPKINLDEVLEDFNGQYEPLGTYFYCVQFISSKKLRITFNSATLMEDCLSAGLSLRGFPLEPQPISLKKWVSVQRLAIGIPIEAATRILGKYGKVFAAKHETKRGIYTGTLSILMEVQTNIPSALRICGHTCLIFYRGQERTCFRCHSPNHTTCDCPYSRYHASTTGDDPPPTTEREPQDNPPPQRDDHQPSEATSHAPADMETAPTTGEDHPRHVPSPSPSFPEDGPDMEGIDHDEVTNPCDQEQSVPESSTDRDTHRTVETDTPVASPSTDADEATSPRTALTGLVTDAAGETNVLGITTQSTTDSPNNSSGAIDTSAPPSTEVLAPPASYVSPVDPQETTTTVSTDITPSATPPLSNLLEFPPIASPPVVDTDSAGFKLPCHSRRQPSRQSSRMRSRSRSASSTDSTSSSGPPTRKHTQPYLVGTGLHSHRSTRGVDITLGQFGALQDFVPDSGAVPDIRLSDSGHLLSDSVQEGNL